MPYLRYHVHSVHSNRDGLLKIDDIIDEAKANNESFVVTDHGSISSWIELYNKCKEKNVKAIFGIEMYINQNRDRIFEIVKLLKDETDPDAKKKLQIERDSIKSHSHIVLVAKNKIGFHNIIRLSNMAFIDGFYSKPVITYDELFKLKDGLIVSTACLGGTLAKLLENKKFKKAKQFVEIMKNKFGDDFYLEAQCNSIKEQKKLNKHLITLSEKCNVKICIGSDSHYLHLDWRDIHQDLLLLQNKKKREDVDKVDLRITWENNKGEIKQKKIRTDKDFRKGYPSTDVKIGDKFGKDIITNIEDVPRVFSFAGDAPYFSENELRKYAKKNHPELKNNIDEIIQSNYEIYDKIENVDINTEIKLPIIENADKKLTQIVKDGLKNKEIIKKKYIERIKHELKVIKENNFSTYFLILHDFIEYARKRNIPIGAGRGSCVSSLVGYVLGIHRVDPLDKRWGEMPFERFLSISSHDKIIVVEDENGNTKEFRESADITVTRNNKRIKIKAINLKNGDKIL